MSDRDMEFCIKCGNKAKSHCGHVHAKDGSFVLVGWCLEHQHLISEPSIYEKDCMGCYGDEPMTKKKSGGLWHWLHDDLRKDEMKSVLKDRKLKKKSVHRHRYCRCGKRKPGGEKI